MPKPYGYVRLTMPDTCYADAVPKGYPYRFDVSCHAEVRPVSDEQGGQYWIDLHYPALNATVHCSYQPVRGNLRELTDDAIRFVYPRARFCARGGACVWRAIRFGGEHGVVNAVLRNGQCAPFLPRGSVLRLRAQCRLVGACI